MEVGTFALNGITEPTPGSRKSRGAPSEAPVRALDYSHLVTYILSSYLVGGDSSAMFIVDICADDSNNMVCHPSLSKWTIALIVSRV